jgi:UDP-N-acetylglucosamine--N-acetylmuramyl-(pentapeptide) pyrophosphoryl-undecaprenol N-acetylglucosamine transferase
VAKKIIIAGGGTGGHIFPAIAIANAIKKEQPECDILFIGAKGKMEMERVPQAGYEIRGIDIAGFNRSSLLKNVGLPLKLVKSFFQVRNLFINYMPDAVIGVGGYSTFPVLRYAQSKGIPTFIHEANSFAGKSNKLLGKNAKRIFVATDGMNQFFPESRITISGNPVREAIVNSNITREEGIRFFHLDPSKKTVLVVGGSLGAKSINEAIHAGIKEFKAADIQLIWQTGKLFKDTAIEAVKNAKGIYTNDFISRMEYAYAAADVVISRAGAMSIAELAVVSKPVIFVPYPFAAEDHQTENASKLVSKGAGILVKDSEAKNILVNTVIELIKNEPKQEDMKRNIAATAITNADQIVAAEVLRIIDLDGAIA